MGGLVGNKSNIIYMNIIDSKGRSKGIYIVSACNEVVNFTNIKTGEVDIKIFDKEATYGFVTYLASYNNLLAVGFNSGTVIIYNMNREAFDEDVD